VNLFLNFSSNLVRKLLGEVRNPFLRFLLRLVFVALIVLWGTLAYMQIAEYHDRSQSSGDAKASDCRGVFALDEKRRGVPPHKQRGERAQDCVTNETW